MLRIYAKHFNKHDRNLLYFKCMCKNTAYLFVFDIFFYTSKPVILKGTHFH